MRCNDAVHERQAQSGSTSDILGGEQVVEDLASVLDRKIGDVVQVRRLHRTPFAETPLANRRTRDRVTARAVVQHAVADFDTELAYQYW